jgi:NAD(P)-dependent dehydrogenase (short-subunit alcohol dehydrogenase family)
VHLLGTTGERVLVIGADGVLGALTAEAFEDAGWEVVRASRIGDRAGRWRRIDLDRPETVARGLRSVDVVINTVPHAGAVAERLVIEHGGVLLNTSAQPVTYTQRLCKPHPAAVGTVVLGAGIAPGLTNLVAARLLAIHPEADEVEVVFTFSVTSTSGPEGHKFVKRNLMRTATYDAVAVPLPSPFGTRECVPFGEPERAWIGNLAGSRPVRSYACFAEHDGAGETLMRDRKEGRGKHGGAAISGEPVAHWVCVRKAGVRLAASTIRCLGDYLGAAHATLALAHTLQDARARAPLPTGVFCPDGVVELAQLVPYLTGTGIRVVTETV